MALFPASPANGATANVNGYQFTFNSTDGAWNRTQSFTGNLAVTTISASGNANVGNLGTVGLITATGNITGGNLITSGLLSVTGAVTANYFTAANSLSGYYLANAGTTVGKVYENGNLIKLQAELANYGVALAANGTVQLSFDANGYGAVGSSSGTTGYALRIAKQTTGAASAGSILINPTVQTDVTSTATGVRTSLSTAAGASPYTITNLVGYATYGGTIGANTTVTNQIAYYVDSGATGGTNNWGFYGGLASAASTFNLYMQGTANNYIAGSLGIGSTNLSITNLRVSKSITGGTTAYGALSDGTISSDVTATAALYRSSAITQAASFTLANLVHYQAVQGTFGASSVVTTQTGFLADSTLATATNNYGFRGLIAAGANNYNLYLDGTANNLIAGNVTFSGTGQQILGDFSNATLASRTVFQSKTTDTATDIPILPNGAGTGASLNTFNKSNIANSAYVVMGANATVTKLYSATTGTATLLPLAFGMGSTEAARFDTGGNLLVGTTTSSGKLTVVNSGTANTATVFSTGNISGNPNTTANVWKQAAFVSNGGYGGGIALNNGGGSNDGFLMYLTSTPSQLNIQYGSNGGNTGSAGVTLTSTGTSWSAFSDERLKTDLQPIANAIQKSSSLRTVTGRYKTDPEGTVRSFLIAQDVLPVVPSAVSTNEDGMLLLSRDELIPLLFATVNELSAQLAELKAEVNNLKNP